MPPFIERVKLTFPLDIGTLPPDGTVDTEMRIGTIEQAADLLTLAMFQAEEQP